MKRLLLIILVSVANATTVAAQNTPPGMTLAEVAATKIKSEEAGVENRRAAVRYLGTVDWHYYPEAEVALIAALRADRNESVRVEAAFSLGNGGGRTGKTLEALRIVLGGSEQDGNPAESSEHVKAAALTALNHCQTRSKSSIALEMPQVPPPTMIAGPPAPLTLQLTSARAALPHCRPCLARHTG